MARLTLTVAVLFFLFTFSNARNSLDLQASDVVNQDLANSLPEIETERSETEDSEPIMLAEASRETSLPLAGNEKAVGTVEESPESETHIVKSVKSVPLDPPLTIVRFRPINRHIRPNRLYPFRFPRPGCHHAMMKPHGHRREVSFGNDMLIADDLREFPERWIRFDRHRHHDHHHRHHHGDHETFEKLSFRKPFRHEDEEDDSEDRKEKEGGLMKRFRDFIDDLF